MATATRTREHVCPFCGQENELAATQCIRCQQFLAPKQPLAPIRPAVPPTPYTRWVLIGTLLGCLPGVLLYVLAHSGLAVSLPQWVIGPMLPLFVGGEGIWAIITAIDTKRKNRRLLAGGILIGLCISLLIRYSIPTTM